MYCFQIIYVIIKLFIQFVGFQIIIHDISFKRLYACPVEIGKELAVILALPFMSVDVQCSIAILYIYIKALWPAKSNSIHLCVF